MSDRIGEATEQAMATASESAVREAYDFFDHRRTRDQPFDEGDMQNVHSWMLAVTRAICSDGAGTNTGDAA